MRRLMIQILVLLALSVVGGLATKRWHPYAPVPKSPSNVAGEGEVLVEEALRWNGEGQVVWIDARSRKEFDQGHAPGAFRLNEAEWDDLLWESGPELMEIGDKRFVVYCGNKDCHASNKVAEKLRERGFIGVFVLRGGWPALKAALGPP
jgi:rhodanese-related sulfurtransferase